MPSDWNLDSSKPKKLTREDSERVRRSEQRKEKDAERESEELTRLPDRERGRK